MGRRGSPCALRADRAAGLVASCGQRLSMWLSKKQGPHAASGAVGIGNRQEDQTQQVAKGRKCILSELREAHPVRVGEVGQAASGHR